ncbi:MAG: SurA N-terminal domain-containing protein [Candidatus Tectomicrobia bacterium]|uniref:Periplasmic chaperone PpiD n=1 Tax=Tectimicrobiota bacterium TaxID=2528274 RepID=A0A932ZT16_UNCTE|nr:SurA N-terminal domain-containing protein [Candidatus Tectomicrobia bacterium]
MLRFFRERGNSWILKGLLGLVALTFISWGGFTLVQGPVAEGGKVVAWVNDTPISQQEYEGAYFRQVEALRRQLGAQFKDELIQQLGVRQQVLASLVSEKLQLQEAGRLGIRVSDAEVALRIQEVGAFQRGGRFDPLVYRQVLESNRLSPRQFEEAQRSDIATERLRRYIGMAASVSDAEVREAYRLLNERIKVRALSISPAGFEKEAAAQASEKDLREHYEKNKEQFRVGPQRKAQWWHLSYEAVLPRVSLSDQELKARYEQTRSRYALADEVKLSQIFIKLAPDGKPDQAEAARKKLAAFRDRIRKGADFAALAKANSQDPSASKGGDMGAFKRGEMIPDLEKAAFSLAKGEVSEPVRTSFGYHLLLVRERQNARQRTFEEARAEVEKELRQVRAKSMARDELRAVRYAIEDKKPAPAVQGLTAGETGFFAQAAPPSAFPEGQELAEIIFRIGKKGEISSEAEGKKGMLFARLVDLRDARVPSFDEVAAEVRKNWQAGRALQIARAKAEGWLREIKDGKRTLERLANELKAKLITPEPFARPRVPEELNAGAEGVRSLFRLRKGGVERVFAGMNVLLVQCLEPASLDTAKFPQEKDSLRERLLQERQRLLFLRHLEGLRQAAKLRIERGFSL